MSKRERTAKILETINFLFEEMKESSNSKKNIELIWIGLPKKEWELLEENSEFRKYHNLGGIPCSRVESDKIKIEIELCDPRKRKKKAIVHVR